MRIEKRGQVWIESVLYSLIGIALALITPKINEAKDKIVVDQSIESLDAFRLKIDSALDKNVGNIRKLEEFKIKRGELLINATGDNIMFILDDLSKPYSEPGIVLKIGRVEVISEKG